MKALIYLLLTTLKNKIKAIIKHPAKLILSIFFVLFIILIVVIAIIIPVDIDDGLRDVRELYLIVLGVFALITYTSVKTGIKSGATFFTMPDVNLLFTSPLKPKQILNYGLIKQMGSSLLIGVFLIFQFYWIRHNYNLAFWNLIIILVNYSLMIFTGQLSAMAIYSYTSISEPRKRTIKYVFYTLTCLIVIYVGYIVFNNLSDFSNILVSLSNQLLFLIPIAGWLTAGFIGVVTYNIIYIILGYGLTLIMIMIIIMLISKFNTDFYEDVLQSTETTHSAIKAYKEGKGVEALPTKVKVGKIGINQGKEASVFYYKHLKESKRSKVFILDQLSITLILSTTAFAFIMKEHGILPVYFFSLFMVATITSQGRWIRELNRHYVYLVPDSPFKKLIMVSLENIRKMMFIAIIQYLLIFLVTGADFPDVIICALGYFSFSILFIAITILSERFFGRITSKSIASSLHFMLIGFVSTPGIIISMIVASMIYQYQFIFISLLFMFLYNILVSLIIVFLCRNILVIAELD